MNLACKKIATRSELMTFFEKNNIKTKTYEHPPAFTVEEGNLYWGSIEGIHCKNLFLKDAKGSLWLVVAPSDLKINLKALPNYIGSKRLSFGSENLLMETLGLAAGSVTPFGIINDKENRVRLVLDKGMMESDVVNYHPLENTATTSLSPDDLIKFVRACGHVPQIVDLKAVS